MQCYNLPILCQQSYANKGRNATLKTVPPNTNPPLRLYMSLQHAWGHSQADWLIQAPGRDMWLAAIATDGHSYKVFSGDIEAHTEFDHRSAKGRRTVLKRPLPTWARYPAGVIVTLGDGGMDVPAFHAVFVGDEPSGPRYDFSTGLLFATFAHELTDTPYTPASLMEVVEAVRRTL